MKVYCAPYTVCTGNSNGTPSATALVAHQSPTAGVIGSCLLSPSGCFTSHARTRARPRYVWRSWLLGDCPRGNSRPASSVPACQTRLELLPRWLPHLQSISDSCGPNPAGTPHPPQRHQPGFHDAVFLLFAAHEVRASNGSGTERD